MEKGNPEKLIVYLEKMFKLKYCLPEQRAHCLFSITLVLESLDEQYISKFQIFLESLIEDKREPELTDSIYFTYTLCNLYYYLVKKIAKSNPAKAQNYLERASNHYLIAHNRTVNIKKYLQVFFSKSNAYIALENYEELIEYSQSCLEKFKGQFFCGEDKHILYTKGLGYWHLEDYKKMFFIFSRIKNKFSESELGPKLVFAIEHGLAVYYEAEFKEDKASYHYGEAYKHYLQYVETPWAVEADDEFLAMLKEKAQI